MTDQSDVNRVASDPSLLKKPIKAGIQSLQDVILLDLFCF